VNLGVEFEVDHDVGRLQISVHPPVLQTNCEFPANMVHERQSGPYCGAGFQVKVLKTLQVVLSSRVELEVNYAHVV